MTFDHFVYSFPLFSSLLKKGEEEKENELAKMVIKGKFTNIILYLYHHDNKLNLTFTSLKINDSSALLFC